MCKFAIVGLMDNWDEIRTAAHVVRHGTISAAADALGVHRATVIRHVDALEQELGQKLFQRHARGYTPTEIGLDLLRVADATEEQFGELVRRSKSRVEDLEGDFTITSIGAVGPRIYPAIRIFQERHPKVSVRFLANENVLKLEYGEAHIAFRAGAKPTEPDNVVRLFDEYEYGLYAHRSYVERWGKPNSLNDLAGHRFVGSSLPNPGAPFLKWLHETIPSDQFVFLSNDVTLLEQAIGSGSGIGFCAVEKVASNPDLMEVLPGLPKWQSTIWRVTHVDLHRSAKVQAFIEVLDEIVQSDRRSGVSL